MSATSLGLIVLSAQQGEGEGGNYIDNLVQERCNSSALAST